MRNKPLEGDSRIAPFTGLAWLAGWFHRPAALCLAFALLLIDIMRRVRGALGVVALCLAFALLLIAPVQAQDDTLNPFGVVEGFWLPDDACDMGAGWDRIIFDWAHHQPTGPDDWHTLNVDDRWLEAARDCNREVVALLKGVPDWATDGITGVGVPIGLYLSVDDPGNVWANFVRRAAAYYAERGVRRFIIMNEPDISPETYGFEFEGSVDDYAQILKVAYLAAHEGNPDALIHVAGTTYWHDVNEGQRLYLDRLFEVLTNDPDASAHDFYFDVVTLHIYFRTDTVYEIVRATRDLLSNYGLDDKAIWIDETNASPNLDPQWPVERPTWQITLDQQGAFLAQAAALGLAAGAESLGVYKFYDWSLPPGAESFGLVREDGSRRPAFETWRAVIDHFQGVETAALAQTERVDAVLLTQADQQLLVAWARTADAAQLQVNATGAQSQLIDQYGKMVTLTPVADYYSLALPGARCNAVDGCPVGGYVTMLAQPRGEWVVQEVTPGGLQPLVFE